MTANLAILKKSGVQSYAHCDVEEFMQNGLLIPVRFPFCTLETEWKRLGEAFPDHLAQVRQ